MNVSLGRAHRRDRVAEQVAQVVLPSPQQGRGDSGRRRHVGADGAEHLADEAVRCPGRQPEGAAGPGGSHHLVRGLLVVGREHGSVDRHGCVEGRVLHREVLGVALDELDVDALGGHPDPAVGDELRHVVDAQRRSAGPGGGDGGVAVAAGDVEHPPAGPHVDRVDEHLADDLDLGADHREVAAGPGLLLARLDEGEIGSGRGDGHVVLRGLGRPGESAAAHPSTVRRAAPSDECEGRTGGKPEQKATNREPPRGRQPEQVLDLDYPAGRVGRTMGR